MSTISLELPPLRKRGSDVELLAQYFVGVMNERFGSARRIGKDALAALRHHTWPGNVRELLHAIEGAMVVCEGPEILPEHLPQSVRTSNGRGLPAVAPTASGNEAFLTLEELEKNQIGLALKLSGGHRGHAARMLGISERNLYRKLNELGWPA